MPLVSYDLDCADIGFTVRVIGSDVHRFDGDGDGIGCESGKAPRTVPALPPLLDDRFPRQCGRSRQHLSHTGHSGGGSFACG